MPMEAMPFSCIRFLLPLPGCRSWRPDGLLPSLPASFLRCSRRRKTLILSSVPERPRSHGKPGPRRGFAMLGAARRSIAMCSACGWEPSVANPTRRSSGARWPRHFFFGWLRASVNPVLPIRTGFPRLKKPSSSVSKSAWRPDALQGPDARTQVRNGFGQASRRSPSATITKSPPRVTEPLDLLRRRASDQRRSRHSSAGQGSCK